MYSREATAPVPESVEEALPELAAELESDLRHPSPTRLTPRICSLSGVIISYSSPPRLPVAYQWYMRKPPYLDRARVKVQIPLDRALS